MKKAKANPNPPGKTRPGTVVTIHPAERYQLRVIATLDGPGDREENLCTDDEARYYMRDRKGVRRLSLDAVVRWFGGALCRPNNDASLSWEQEAMRNCFDWIAAKVRDCEDFVREATCVEQGTMTPSSRWTNPPRPRRHIENAKAGKRGAA
jgi:hypothetical protein